MQGPHTRALRLLALCVSELPRVRRTCLVRTRILLIAFTPLVLLAAIARLVALADGPPMGHWA